MLQLQVARVLDIAAISKCTTIGEFDELSSLLGYVLLLDFNQSFALAADAVLAGIECCITAAIIDYCSSQHDCVQLQRLIQQQRQMLLFVLCCVLSVMIVNKPRMRLTCYLYGTAFIQRTPHIVMHQVYGFASNTDYYERNASGPFLKQAAVPILAIQAKDDPFMSPHLPTKESCGDAPIKLAYYDRGGMCFTV
jgi:hypothetical protein